MINQETIKEHIIHRYENLVIESVDITSTDPIAGTFVTDIKTEDTLNREIFYTTGKTSTVIEQTLTEMIALASIVCCGKLKEDEMAIFSSISNFKCEGNFLLGTPINGTVAKVSDKGGFIRFRGETTQEEGSGKASADVLAFFTKASHVTDNIKTVDLPETPDNTDIPRDWFLKNPNMIVADTIRNASEETFSTQYTYPTTHPFIKGHFPNNPLMMGIMQWMSVVDALVAYAKTHTVSATSLTCDAQLIKTNGALVTELKAVSVTLLTEAGGLIPKLNSTKRVYFRSMIKPGESFYTVIENIRLS